MPASGGNCLIVLGALPIAVGVGYLSLWRTPQVSPAPIPKPAE